MIVRMALEFDEVAGNYEAELNRGLKLTGESQAFYAESRMRWVARRLAQRGFSPRTALDFGCGTGGALPFFFKHLSVERVIATDLSTASLDEARRQHPKLNVEFQDLNDSKAAGNLDLAFCNGVFHHIPLAQRLGAARIMYDALRPGGWLAFWENNPWNPILRYAMSRIAFDRDAILVWPRSARRLLRSVGLQVFETNFMFVFPAVLAFLRGIEPWLIHFPLGAQYLVLAQKPDSLRAAAKTGTPQRQSA
jgi:SAM-dependent methyltransferase